MSQCVSSSLGGSHVGVITTTTECFSYRQGRLLTGFEHVSLMGHAEVQRSQFDHETLGTLAGECMFAGSLAMVVWPFYLNSYAPWWR